MYKDGISSGYWLWTITPYTDWGYYAFDVDVDSEDGIVTIETVDATLGVLPTVYLAPDITITKGNGSSDEPYEIE